MPRDFAIAEVVRPVLDEIVEFIFDYPRQKLAPYGELGSDARFTDLTGIVPKRYDTEIQGQCSKMDG